MGYFNYNFDSSLQPHSLFEKLTESLGLQQYINCPTHVSGNILYLIFTPSDISLQFVSSCTRSYLLTDNYLIHAHILLEKSPSTKSLIYYRELRHLH